MFGAPKLKLQWFVRSLKLFEWQLQSVPRVSRNTHACSGWQRISHYWPYLVALIELAQASKPLRAWSIREFLHRSGCTSKWSFNEWHAPLDFLRSRLFSPERTWAYSNCQHRSQQPIPPIKTRFEWLSVEARATRLRHRVTGAGLSRVPKCEQVCNRRNFTAKDFGVTQSQKPRITWIRCYDQPNKKVYFANENEVRNGPQVASDWL